MVIVKLEAIQTGGLANNTGIFSGQNIQNSWDSHSPGTASFGFIMGDFCNASCQMSWLFNQSKYCQPIYDNDYKANQSPITMR